MNDTIECLGDGAGFSYSDHQLNFSYGCGTQHGEGDGNGWGCGWDYGNSAGEGWGNGDSYGMNDGDGVSWIDTDGGRCDLGQAFLVCSDPLFLLCQEGMKS